MIVLVLLISSSPCAGVCSTHNISSFQRFTNNGRVSTAAILPFLHPTRSQNYKSFILQWIQPLEKHHPHSVQPKVKYVLLKGRARTCNAPVTSGVQRSAVMCSTC